MPYYNTYNTSQKNKQPARTQTPYRQGNATGKEKEIERLQYEYAKKQQSKRK